MKKQYANPTLKVVFIEDADIVTESQLTVGEGVTGVSAQSKRRDNNIWGEDE